MSTDAPACLLRLKHAVDEKRGGVVVDVGSQVRYAKPLRGEAHWLQIVQSEVLADFGVGVWLVRGSVGRRVRCQYLYLCTSKEGTFVRILLARRVGV